MEEPQIGLREWPLAFPGFFLAVPVTGVRQDEPAEACWSLFLAYLATAVLAAPEGNQALDIRRCHRAVAEGNRAEGTGKFGQ